jgi:hypothetical protein
MRKKDLQRMIGCLNIMLIYSTTIFHEHIFYIMFLQGKDGA